MRNRNGIKTLDRDCSSYHGRVHNSYIAIKPDVFADESVYMNSVNAGHVVIGEPDLTDDKLEKWCSPK